MDSREITVSVKVGDTPPTPIKVLTSDTLGTLKGKIGELFPGKTITMMIFMGRILKEETETLEQAKLQNGSTILVRAVAAAAGAANPPAATASSAVAPAAQSPAAPAAAAAAAGAPPARAPQQSQSPLAAALGRVLSSPGTAKECLATVLKIVDKVVEQPQEAKFRRIKKSNAAFRRRVGEAPGGEQLLRALGFGEVADDGGTWVLTPTPEAWNTLMQGRTAVQNCLGAVERAETPRGGNTAATAAMGGMGGAPSGGYGAGGNFGGMPPGGVGPQEMAMMQQLLRNPAMMQQVAQSPQVQQMMRSNPEMGRMFQAMAQNPAMMQQMLQQAQASGALPGNSAGGYGSYGAAPSGGYNASVAAPPPPTPPPSLPLNLLPPGMGEAAGYPPQQPATAEQKEDGEEGDDAATEEQLIAEAIARSLQEM